PLEPSIQDGYDDLMAGLAALHFTGGELLERGDTVIARADPQWVAWLNTGQNEGVGLYAAPIEVGPRLQKELFAKKTAVVLTSATLRTGTDFSFIKSRLGLEKPRELALDSTFPYQEAALLLLPQDLPEPQHPDHGRMLETALTDLCRASRGRALVLFTSYSALQTAHRALTRNLANDGLNVLAQGASGSIPRMLERLRRDSKTVILGTSSFWEGVDVVGEALSLLVITRLPFTVPSDPVFAARSELFDDPFRQYAVPQAVLRFRQGFGRLIRSKTDRGVCVVLDKRVGGKSYGNSFLEPLPPVKVERCLLREAPRHIENWLNKGAPATR
ncbi:MAG: helicase C-terminal domain-containing protein, partial [Chloroflexota bacterium]